MNNLIPKQSQEKYNALMDYIREKSKNSPDAARVFEKLKKGIKKGKEESMLITMMMYLAYQRGEREALDEISKAIKGCRKS